MPQPFRCEETVVLPHPPEQVWRFVADTDRVNRILQLPTVSYRFEKLRAGSARVWASARMFGMPMAWEEKPFEWVRGHGYSVERIFQDGPLERYRLGLTLQPEQTGCAVTAFGEFAPRSALLAPAIKLSARREVRRFAALLRQLGEQQLATDDRLPPIVEKPSSTDRAALAAAKQRAEQWIDNFLRPTLDELSAELASAPDREVTGIRPFVWADARGLPRLPTLEVFLESTRAGLLEMEWALLCPHCRGTAAHLTSLAEIPDEKECLACAERFAVELDKAVEARFSISPTIRAATAGIYCRGGPMNTPFIEAQYRLAPGAELRLERAQLDGKRIRVRPDIELERRRLDGDTLSLRNPAGEEAVVSLEIETWENQAATAALIATMPAFQDLFAADVIAPGQKIGVGRIVLLFSDLESSTALYRNMGDARAFGLVREHFDVFRKILAERNGVLVKTIGDAVMAVFLSEAEALAAAREAHGRMPEPLRLKIGIHAGPLLAVQANGHNDYFGSTVNLAARLEGLARAGETVISRAVADAADISGEWEEVQVKGFEECFQVLRIK